jgi:hypothetical protein
LKSSSGPETSSTTWIVSNNGTSGTKGYAAPEPKAAVERARVLIEQAETLGEQLEDPLLLFSVLYGIWAANFVKFNGNVLRDVAAQFLALAEKQGASVPRRIGHRLMGTSLLSVGDFVQARAHFDRAIALYDPIPHRPLVTRFGQDSQVAAFFSAYSSCFRKTPIGIQWYRCATSNPR